MRPSPMKRIRIYKHIALINPSFIEINPPIKPKTIFGALIETNRKLKLVASKL